jgi:hypothetical protein
VRLLKGDMNVNPVKKAGGIEKTMRIGKPPRNAVKGRKVGLARKKGPLVNDGWNPYSRVQIVSSYCSSSSYVVSSPRPGPEDSIPMPWRSD